MPDNNYIKPKPPANASLGPAKPEPQRPRVVPILKEATRVPTSEQTPTPTAGASQRAKQRELAAKEKAPAPRPAGVREPATSEEFPCLCPGENFPITRPVCRQRQDKGYNKCADCPHVEPSRRHPRDGKKER